MRWADVREQVREDDAWPAHAPELPVCFLPIHTAKCSLYTRITEGLSHEPHVHLPPRLTLARPPYTSLCITHNAIDIAKCYTRTLATMAHSYNYFFLNVSLCCNPLCRRYSLDDVIRLQVTFQVTTEQPSKSLFSSNLKIV